MSGISPHEHQKKKWGTLYYRAICVESLALFFTTIALIVASVDAHREVQDMEFCNGKWWDVAYDSHDGCYSYDPWGFVSRPSAAVVLVILPATAFLVTIIDLVIWSCAHKDLNPTSRRKIAIVPTYTAILSLFLCGLWAGQVVIGIYAAPGIEEYSEYDLTYGSLICRFLFDALLLLTYFIYACLSIAAKEKQGRPNSINGMQA